jgi:hypothetical protein
VACGRRSNRAGVNGCNWPIHASVPKALARTFCDPACFLNPDCISWDFKKASINITIALRKTQFAVAAFPT